MYRNLCIVLVLFAVSKFTSTDAEPANVLHVMKHCREAHNISDEVFGQLFLRKLPSEINDPNAQCFMACWLEQMRILKSDGTLDLADFSNNLLRGRKDADEVAEELRKCADQPGEGCEKKYKIAVCIEHIGDRIIFQKSGETEKRNEAQ